MLSTQFISQISIVDPSPQRTSSQWNCLKERKFSSLFSISLILHKLELRTLLRCYTWCSIVSTRLRNINSPEMQRLRLTRTDLRLLKIIGGQSMLRRQKRRPRKEKGNEER